MLSDEPYFIILLCLMPTMQYYSSFMLFDYYNIQFPILGYNMFSFKNPV
jgi:hypothetical protein